jgi:hypothetical protein
MTDVARTGPPIRGTADQILASANCKKISNPSTSSSRHEVLLNCYVVSSRPPSIPNRSTTTNALPSSLSVSSSRQ